MPQIHPSAVVSPDAILGEGVEIGPHCVLNGRVRLAAGARLIGAVHVNGPVEIGEGTQVYPGVCVGFPGQDYKFKLGDPTAGVVIGADCILREGASIHAATKVDQPTRLGNRVFMMAGAHVGHDGQIGNNVIMVNVSLVGGHGQVHDNATMGGAAVLHQFTRIGRLAFLGGSSGTSVDIPPFCIATDHNSVIGVNVIGMRRNGIARDDITRVREAYRMAFRRGLQRGELLSILDDLGGRCELVREMADFVRASKRSIASDRSGREMDNGDGDRHAG